MITSTTLSLDVEKRRRLAAVYRFLLTLRQKTKAGEEQGDPDQEPSPAGVSPSGGHHEV